MTEPQTSHAPQQPSTAAGTEPTGHLQRATLGVSDIVFFFVVAAAAPFTVMAGVAPLAILFGGIGAPVAYLTVGIVLCLFAIGFTAMTPHIRNAGAFYSYIARGLGRPAGLGVALLAVFSCNAMQIGTYGAVRLLRRRYRERPPGRRPALAGLRLRRDRRGVVPRLPVDPCGRQDPRRPADRGDRHPGAARWRDPPQGRLGRTESDLLRPLQRLHVEDGRTAGPRHRRLHRLRGHRPLPRRGPRSRPCGASRHVPGRRLPRPFLHVRRLGHRPGLRQRQRRRGRGAEPRRDVLHRHDPLRGRLGHDLQRVLIVSSLLASLLVFHNAITRCGYALSVEGAAPAPLGRIHPRHGSPWVSGIAQTVLAAVVTAVFAAIGAHPYNEFLLWVKTPGVVGILALQTLAACSVAAFFCRNRGVGGAGRLRTVAAAASAALLLAVITGLVCTRLNLFTGAPSAVNWMLAALTPIVFTIGAVLAMRLRRKRPEVYAKLATTDVEAV